MKRLLIIFLLIFWPVSALAAVLPNDAFFSNQANYFNQVKIPDAWSQTTGSNNVIIAVIDSGVDTDHPDLMNNIWFNSGEIALNGIDDDNNGYVDDLNGWDFIENSSDIHPKIHDNSNFPGLNHGTIISGIAAEMSNNTEGLAGVCWQCKIMPLRAIDGNGSGVTINIAKAIDYAVDNGADIINMSFVGSATDDILTKAINRAYDAGVVLVAAVGNEAGDGYLLGGDLDFNPLYPVCSDGPFGANHILGVGSVEKDNTKSSFSNYGWHCIDINAPGSNIAAPQLYDPTKGEKYNNKYLGGWRGTSMSTPIVAGVAGLIKSINPKLTNKQIIDIVRQTGINIDQINPLYFGQLGGGLLDASAAVKLAAETPGLGQEKNIIKNKNLEILISNILITPRNQKGATVAIKDPVGQTQAKWLAFGESYRGGVNAVSGDVDGDGTREVIIAPAGAGGPQVRVFSAEGELRGQWFAAEKTLRTGVNMVTVDINNDGIDEIITSIAKGQNNQIKIFDYQGNTLGSWSIKSPGLKQNLPITAMDIDADDQVEIIIGAVRGTLPIVQIFDTLGKKEASWLAYAQQFRGGVNVASGDVDGDGKIEIITVPANSGLDSQVKIFTTIGKLKNQFLGFEKTYRNGLSVAVANVDQDKPAEIILGTGAGRVGEVRIFSKFGSDFVQDGVFNALGANYKDGINIGI